jgi:hypothetical protein
MPQVVPPVVRQVWEVVQGYWQEEEVPACRQEPLVLAMPGLGQVLLTLHP